jgi:hypothetical protein
MHKKDTNKKIKWETFFSNECRARKFYGRDVYFYYYYYKIFGLYKYNPKISHWKNFCNRLKWPLSHEKLKNVIIPRGDKIFIVTVVSISWMYAIRGGPKYIAFWVWLIIILALLMPFWFLPVLRAFN